MLNVILCITLLNIGISSQQTSTYNMEVIKIENIMNEAGLCRVFPGESFQDGAICSQSNINRILRHYHFNMEANWIK